MKEMFNIKLPIEERQKFQIGDVCKVKVEEFEGQRECIILHTYSQVYWGNNFSDYSVYLLPNNKNEYTGSFAWVEECQLQFVRKPMNKEISIVVQEDSKMLSYEKCPYKSIFRNI